MSLELVSEIGDMKSNNSELELKLKKKRKLPGAVGAFFKGFFVDEFKKAEISAEMVEGESEESDFFVETFYQEDGEFSVQLKPKGRQVKPGLHKVVITLKDEKLTGNETISFVQDFSWGVLAFNSNKSIYQPDENAYLQMGVLDELGHTVCGADLEMIITAPDKGKAVLSTKNGLIIRNPECGPDNVILTPDYYANYGLGEIGEYTVKLIATTEKGSWEISDVISVQAESPFVVERIGPTRINPTAEYGMMVKIRANEDFSGNLIEKMPEDFKISNFQFLISNQLQITNYKLQIDDAGKNLILENIILKKGDEATLIYKFDAPDIFPEFYLLGPLEAISAQGGPAIGWENRSWQIASDGENQVIVAQKIAIDAGTADTVNWTEAVKATSTLFSGGQKYFVYVTAGFSGSVAGVISNFEILYGSTIQYSGSIEASGDQANDAMQISWFDVMDQAATPEDIILRYRTVSGTSYIMNAQIVAMNISNLETTDWKYAVNSTSRALTTTVTADANITMNNADGVKDWLVFAMAEIDISSALRQYVSQIYNGASASMSFQREGENTNEFLPHAIYRPFDNVAQNTVFSIRNYSITSNVNTHLRSRVFALNLNRFESFKTYYADLPSTAINGTWTVIGNLNSGGNYAPQTSGDQLIFSSFINDITANTNESDDRLQVNGVTVPTSWSWGQSPAGYRTGYDAADEPVHNIVARVSIPTTGQTISLDAIEVPNSTQVGDEVSLAAFSTRLKNINRPFGVVNSKSFRADGSGVVDFAFDVSDRDLDDARVKVEYEQGSTCAFSSSAKTTISTVDADTTATYGDPKVDNTNAYQVGTTTGWITTTFGTSTVNFDWTSQANIPYASSTYCVRLTANDGTNDQLVSATTTVYIDNFDPIISGVAIPDRMYKIGDTMTATITLATAESDALTIGTSSEINGGPIFNLQKINNTTFTADYLIASGQTDRASNTIPFEISLVDPYLNQSASSSGSFSGGSIDANAPEITAVEIVNLMYGIGDIMTATITTALDASLYLLETSSLNAATSATANLTKINNTTYTLEYTVAEGNVDRATGTIPYHIVLRDSYGNINAPYAGVFANGSLDAHAPIIQAVYLNNGAYGINSSLPIIIDTAETGLALGESTVNGKTLSGFSDLADTTYQAYYIVAEGDMDRTAGNVPISIIMRDNYGNENAAYVTPAANTASVDAHKPEILSIVIPNLVYKIGDTIRATATVAADVAAYTLGTTTVNNVAASNLQKYDNSTYTFDYTVLSGHTDRSAGTIPFSLMLKDQLEQYNDPAFTAITANTASIDANAPAVSALSFAPSSGVLKIGDTATATITAASAETGLSAGATININSKDARASFTELGGGEYRIVYIVAEGDVDRPDNDDLPVNIILRDSAGNESVAFQSSDPTNRPGVDANRPVISNVTFNITSGVLKIGDTATATIYTDGTGYLADTITVNGIDVSGTLVSAGGNDYTITYTVAEGHDDILDANDLPINIVLSDPAGNDSIPYTTEDASNRPGVDGHKPVISNVSFNITSGVLKIGDIATTTIFADASGYSAGAITINGVDVSGTLASAGGNDYTVSYIVIEGNNDILDANNLPISIVLRDVAGNNSVTYVTIDSANRPGVDAHRPVINSAVFVPSSGILKIGASATATLSVADAEENLSIISATINYINVASSFFEIGSGDYRLVYTVSEGDNPINDIADLPVYFVVSDAAGNYSLAFNSSDPSNRPGVDASQPIISNVIFNITSGMLKIGDTATATIYSDETGYSAGTITVNNVDVSGTLASAGGNNYTVAYTVAEGHDDILDENDLPINIVLRDSAGNDSNPYTTEDAGNRPGVDGHAPVISNVSFNITSGLLKIGDIATATISADASGYLAGAITINGVDVSASLASAGGNNYTVNYIVSEGHNDILDSSDLPISVVLVDTNGNNSSTYTTADAGNRPGVDGHAPTVPGNLGFYSRGNNSITLNFGATTTESNFSEYVIYYKAGTSGVSENDSRWDSGDDGHLGHILFSGYGSTTITGLLSQTAYVFNIWAYDQAGNKTQATEELSAATNYLPLLSDNLEQRLNDNFTVVSNNAWAIDQSMVLSASSTDPEGGYFDYYYEVISATGTLTTATSVPASSCNSGTGFLQCSEKIWKQSTGPDWYNEEWLYRKQIVIDSDLIEDDMQDFPILTNTVDDDLRRNARSDGHDILFTAADGVTKLSYERKVYDSSDGELIAWVKTDVSSSTDTIVYMYYGNADVASDQSSASGVWDSSYLGVWHMDEEPTGSADDIKDSSGNSRHMTSFNMGASKRVKTDTGYAYEFDGAGDYLEDADGENYINGLSEFTVELWLKSDLIATDRGFIIGSAPAGNDSFFTLRYDDAGVNGGGNDVIKGAITTTVTGEIQMESSSFSQTTDWQHLVFRWESGRQYELLVDGDLDTPTSNDPAGTGLTSGASTLRIGQGGKDITTALGWDGLIDEVRISNVYRSDAWVKTAYNNQSNLASFALFGAQDAVRIFNLPESDDGYIWQVMACDQLGACSEWVKYNEESPNFKVDNTPPTAPGSLSENSKTSTSVTFNLSGTSTESFFSDYRIYYKEYGGDVVSTNDSYFGTSSDANLSNILFNGASTTTVPFLTADTEYQFNIWAFDESGQSASATPIVVTTEIGTNRPTGLFDSVEQKRDGSGRIDIGIIVNDLDNNPSRARIDYVSGVACNFSSPLDPYLDEDGANISATNLPAPLIDNASAYQVGTGSEWILTAPAANNVGFDWLSALNLSGVEGNYCLRLTVNDGVYSQLVPATSTVYIDNARPSSPGALSLAEKNTETLVLTFGATSTETNFAEYKIFYKIADGTAPDESDSVLSSSTDINLSDKFFNTAATTTISDLMAGTIYSIVIWAYDDYGNAASSSYVNFTTNHIPSAPTNLRQYKADGVTEIVNNGWTIEDIATIQAEVNDGDAGENISLYFELLANSDTFRTATTVPFNACAPDDSWSDCASKIWKVTSVAGDYSVAPFSGTTSPANLPNSNSGFKWQVIACDNDNVCSEWTRYNDAIPNFKIDFIAPTAPGDLSVAAYTSNSITLNFGATTTEENFKEYIIYYKEGTSGVNETNTKHGSSTDGNLAHILFNSAATTTISGLNAGTAYFFNIWAYDQAGNKNYAVYEISTTTNNKPQSNIVSAMQKTNGTGGVDIVISANDADVENLFAMLEFATGTDCLFTSAGDPTLDEIDANATSSQADAKIENDNAYQIGNASGWIVTTGGANAVSFDWLSNTDLPNQSGTYCLRIRTNDGHEDSVFATTTLMIDNLSPTAPGNLSLIESHGNYFVLGFGATSTETNWLRYRIFYKQGVSTVNENDLELIDSDLADKNYNNTATTSVSGLLANTQYSFRVFAYDIYGNKAQSGQETFTTNSYPSSSFNSAAQKIDGSGRVDISLEIYDTDGDNCYAKLEFATGTACDFSSPGDPELDEGSENISVDYEPLGIANTNEYQIGTAGAPIITDQGSNTIDLDWLSKSNLPTADGDYCLRLTVTDGSDTHSATTTLTIDNAVPQRPADLTIGYADVRTIRLDFGSAGSDTHFKEYKIFYKEGVSGVAETDSAWDKNDDAALGIEDFGAAASTTIGGLLPDTDYVFNIWIYDDFGNKSFASGEISSSTLEAVSATWRETEDTPDPTTGVYASKEQTVRLRVAVANSGTWSTEDYRYDLQYGIKDGTCENVSAWTLVPATAAGEHFEMKSSVYFIENASTTPRLTGDGYAFRPGYMVQAPFSQTGTITLYGNEYSELEYTIAATTDASRSATYCFRAVNQGAGVDDYGVYPEFSLTPPPLSDFVSAVQRDDGSGRVDVRFTADDYSNQNLRLRMDYATGTLCDFSQPGDLTFDILNENTSATYGDPLIDNDAPYQIGTGLAYVLTQYGENTVDSDWLSGGDLGGIEGEYCLRLTANDLFDDQTIPATTTVMIDNKAPTAPGNLSLMSKTINSVTIELGATSSDLNFFEYRIYYKEGVSGVTESDSMHASNTDPNLGNVLYNGAASTTINNLIANRQYVFRIYAYDKYGNKSASVGEFTTKLVPSISGIVYAADGITPILTAPNVTMVVNGAVMETVSASAANGRFIFWEIDPPATGTPMLVYVNGNSMKGATYSLYGGAGEVTDMHIYSERVVLRHYGSEVIGNEHIETYDNDQDADIMIQIDGGNLSILGNSELYIWPGSTFKNNASVLTLFDVRIEGTLDASSTEIITVSGNWNAENGIFNAASSSVKFVANDQDNVIVTNKQKFYNLEFDGLGGKWTLIDGATTTATTTISQGTLVQGGDVDFETGSLIIELGANFTKASGTGVFVFEDLGQGVFEDKNDVKNNLGNVIIGHSPASTFLASDMVADSLTVNSGDSLFARGYELDITRFITVNGTLDCIDDSEGDGTIITLGTNWTVLPTATFIAGNSTTTFDNATGGIISTGGIDANHDFYNLSFAKTAATTTVLGGYPLKVSGDLTIGANSTLDVSSSNYDIYAGGNWINNGVYNARNATTTFDSVSTGKIINPGQSAFNRIIFNSASGGWNIIGNATSSSDWIMTSASAFSVSADKTIEVRGQYILADTIPDISTWNSGSTLYLNNGGAYTVATKNQSAETYANLKIGADTDIRMWNSGSDTASVDSSGSLYSMDYAGTNGALRIWGDYHSLESADYWSYAKDFDGADISGTPRACQIQIFGGSNLDYSSSVLEIVGTSGATTTIANQSSGAYSLSIADTFLTMDYFQIRNIDSNGLNISGTTTLGSINNGDFELDVEGGALISVTAETINASSWSTSTNIRFATSTGIANGNNVKLSGIPTAPWTFVSHYGNLAGEAFDSDSGDPRGYILWDDSPSYSPKSQNWRWYHDEDKETPLIPIALENYSPQIVGNGNLIKLRMTIKETEGISGANVKMRLQYSTDSNFDSDVSWVGEKGSTTALWTCGEGIDNDNDLISTLALTDSLIKATHNESGISTTSFAHSALDANEWEFTLYANSPATSTTYYFRAFSSYYSVYSDYEKAVLKNGASAYPSVVVSSAVLNFTIEGLPGGTDTEGIITDFPTTVDSVSFGSLPLNTRVEGAHRFKITTNAESGYQLFVYQRQDLVSNTGAYISAISYTNNNPGPWPENPDPGAFGYHSGDDTLSGNSPSRFLPDNMFAKFNGSLEEISYSPIPVSDDSVDFVYRLEVNDLQSAGDYRTSIVYILVPQF
ncbi:MAG: hypothetical protein US83_C0006G0047 [Candidatus Falkowbacteria bacterium GW2011_GWC2_38_22]|nr:MAG: hypothetical protein US83_C0006G0047 [Candidatus Falkowbacteria bacterium GW2011_GWC2_38_22]